MGISVATLALAKKFTKETAQQMGAVKGAPCTVESVEKEGKINTVTLQWENDQGATETTTVQIADGTDGHDGQDGAPGRDGKDGKDGISTSENTIATVGFTEDCDFVCDGTADNIEIQAAIDKIATKGGGIVYIRDGNYTFNCAVEPKSNVEINMSTGTYIKMDDQQIWTLPETTVANSKTVKVNDEILDYIQAKQMVGFTDGTPGYIYDNGTTRHADYITEVDKDTKTITLLYGMPNSTFTTMVTTDCAFYHSDQMGTANNFIIRGGIIDGNVEHQTVWMHDMGHNGILIGTDGGNILIENVEVKNFWFQGIHPMPYSSARENRQGVTTVIRRCYTHNLTFSGVCCDSAGDIAIEDCVAANCMAGFQGVDVEKICISNFQIKNCTAAGIMINGNPYNVPAMEMDNNIKITNCTIKSNPVGIVLQNTKNSTINNCIIEDNTNEGIKLQDKCSSIFINGISLNNNGLGIKETADCSNNTANALHLNNNSIDFNVSSMKIGDNKSDVDLTKKTNSVLYVEDNQGTMGGIVVDPSLIETNYVLLDLSDMKETWEVHEGYARAKQLTGLKPSTQYTIWTSIGEASNPGTLYFNDLGPSVEESGGYKTATSDENGSIWMWVISGRPEQENYLNGVNKVTLAEGTKPQPYIDTIPIMYTSKPTNNNKILVVNTIKSLVADSTDFDDFKSKIAAL